MGRVWDDSGQALPGGGGQCISQEQAQQQHEAAGGTLHMDIIHLSHDGGLAGFGEEEAHNFIR